MKKIILFTCFIALTGAASAQQIMSKSGTPILPEKGDWSIGFDAGAVLTYASSLWGHANSGSNFSQINNTLVALFVKNEHMAYRATLRLGFGGTTHDNLVDQDGSVATPKAQVVDEWTTSNTNITVGGGLQWNRGKGRLHGIYGAQLMLMLGASKDEFIYGNPFSTATTTPNTTDFNQPLATGGYTAAAVSTNRPLENKAGSTFGVGINGFFGAEFFFAPKMSLSAEYGWGLMTSSTGEGTKVDESWDSSTNAVKTTTVSTGKSSAFNLDVINSSAFILHLYF